MVEFKIKRGYKQYLLDDDNKPLIDIEEGCWYLTLDTVEVFVAINGKLEPLNQAQINIDDYDERFDTIESRLDALENKSNELLFADRNTFPPEGDPNKIYIAVDKNELYIYKEGEYQLLSGGSTEVDIDIIDGGSAVN